MSGKKWGQGRVRTLSNYNFRTQNWFRNDVCFVFALNVLFMDTNNFGIHKQYSFREGSVKTCGLRGNCKLILNVFK